MSEPSRDDAKAKFLEALEKKKKNQSVSKNGDLTGPKVSGGQTSGKTPKMFRRKSGSA
jgi:Family of unknown function (DUF5302)